MKAIQFCVLMNLVFAPFGAMANFNDNNGPDQVDKYLGRVSRFSSGDRLPAAEVKADAPGAIDSSSFGPSEMGRSPASVGGVGGAAGNNRGPASLDPKAESKEPETLSLSEIQKRGGVQEVAIISNDLGFFPANIVLTKGIPARLFLSSTGKTQGQCFMLDEFKIRRQIKHDKIEEIQINPDSEGRYTFHCPMNGAKGTILVKAIR